MTSFDKWENINTEYEEKAEKFYKKLRKKDANPLK
jgi:hypothetical protein